MIVHVVSILDDGIEQGPWVFADPDVAQMFAVSQPDVLWPDGDGLGAPDQIIDLEDPDVPTTFEWDQTGIVAVVTTCEVQ